MERLPWTRGPSTSRNCGRRTGNNPRKCLLVLLLVTLLLVLALGNKVEIRNYVHPRHISINKDTFAYKNNMVSTALVLMMT